MSHASHRFTGSIPQHAEPSSVFAVFEILSGGPRLSPHSRWEHPFNLTGAGLDHTLNIAAPVDVMRSESYGVAAASLHASTTGSNSSEYITLCATHLRPAPSSPSHSPPPPRCQRDVRIFFEDNDARSSVSDNGAYPLFCEEAANDAHVFAHFKSHPDYSQIVTSLDHREALGLFVPMIRRLAKEGELSGGCAVQCECYNHSSVCASQPHTHSPVPQTTSPTSSHSSMPSAALCCLILMASRPIPQPCATLQWRCPCSRDSGVSAALQLAFVVGHLCYICHIRYILYICRNLCPLLLFVTLITFIIACVTPVHCSHPQHAHRRTRRRLRRPINRPRSLDLRRFPKLHGH